MTLIKQIKWGLVLLGYGIFGAYQLLLGFVSYFLLGELAKHSDRLDIVQGETMGLVAGLLGAIEYFSQFHP